MTSFSLLLSQTARATAFDIMGAIDRSPAAPQNGKSVVVASPLGDCHVISRWVIFCGARHLGYTPHLLGEVDPIRLRETCQNRLDPIVVLTWLLTPSQPQLKSYLSAFNALPRPPHLILGGLTVSKSWIAEIAPLYKGTLSGAHSALDLLRMLQCTS